MAHCLLWDTHRAAAPAGGASRCSTAIRFMKDWWSKYLFEDYPGMYDQAWRHVRARMGKEGRPLPDEKSPEADDVRAEVRRLAAALGVKRTPQAHTYRGMKLSDSHVGPDAIRLFCSAIEGAGVSSGADGGSQDSAASEGRGADGTGEDFSPPPQAEWKTATRRFRAGKADFYAKYPCLRCGQAWWVGTDWGGRCARCGAKDTSGYDANEKPLPNREADYRRFVRMLRAGEVPPYSKA